MGIESSQKGSHVCENVLDACKLGYFRGLGMAGPARVLLEHADQCRDPHGCMTMEDSLQNGH